MLILGEYPIVCKDYVRGAGYSWLWLIRRYSPGERAGHERFVTANFDISFGFDRR
jgi:hypothetical protein